MDLVYRKKGLVHSTLNQNDSILYAAQFHWGLRKRQIDYTDPQGNLVGVVKPPGMRDMLKGKNEYSILDQIGTIVGSIKLSSLEVTGEFEGKKISLSNYRFERDTKLVDMLQNKEVIATVDAGIDKYGESVVSVYDSSRLLFIFVFLSLLKSNFAILFLRHFERSDFTPLEVSKFSHFAINVPDKKVFKVKEQISEFTVKREYDNPVEILILLILIVGIPIIVGIITTSIGFGILTFVGMIVLVILLAYFFPDIMKFEHMGQEYSCYKKRKHWYIKTGIDKYRIPKLNQYVNYYAMTHGWFKIEFKYNQNNLTILPITKEGIPLAVRIYHGTTCILEMVGNGFNQNKSVFYMDFSIHYKSPFNFGDAVSVSMIIASTVFKYESPPSEGGGGG